MLRLACCLALAATLSAVEAVFIGYGVPHRVDRDSRRLTDDDPIDWLHGGHHVIIGGSSPEIGFVGYPWFDLEWVRNSGDDATIDTYAISYIERVPLWRFWLGAGIGTTYNRIDVSTPSQSFDDSGFEFAAKAVAGMKLFAAVYTEASYMYSGSMHGVDLNFFAIDVGLRF